MIAPQSLWRAAAAAPLIACMMPLATIAQPAPEVEPDDDIKLIANARVRYETVDRDANAETANALTYRLRAGLETSAIADTVLLIEVDHVQDLIGEFNSTLNGRTEFPVVADPSVTELNRLQLVNTSLPDTKVTLGRQRLILDDARFVGNVGWRQNEQTFDGLRVQNTSFGRLSIDVSYINQVNRIFGNESPVGVWEGDNYIVNVSYPTALGKVTGFAYLLDIDNAGGVFSSQTLGARLAGAKEIGGGKLSYVASYAQQDDYGASPFDYGADYAFAEGTFAKHGFSGGIGYEVLGADTERAFQAPLATLHKFQGWADVFLATPATGVEDRYVKLGFAPGQVGPLQNLKFLALNHDFTAEQGGADYGSELNLLATAKWKTFGFTFKFADYDADEFAVDTQKVWLQTDINF